MYLPNIFLQIRAQLRRLICPFDDIYVNVPVGSSVFDLGCGTGALLVDLIRNRSVRKVGGSEMEQSLLEHALRAVENASDTEIIASDFVLTDSIPYNIGAFEVITLVDVIHHIPQAGHIKFFSDLSKSMKPGATLLLKDIDAGSPLVSFNRLHDAIFGASWGQEISTGKAIEMLKASGLKITRVSQIQKLWYPHYLILAEKP